MEKKGILGNTTGRRPGDVMIPLWSEGKSLVIDVAVTSHLLRLMSVWRNPASGMLQPKSTGNMMRISRAPSILFVL